MRNQSSSIPLDALEIWMKIAHPRIRESERKLRLTALQEYLLETDEQQKIVKRRRVEDATLRRFQVQWGRFNMDRVHTGCRGLDRYKFSLKASRTGSLRLVSESFGDGDIV